MKNNAQLYDSMDSLLQGALPKEVILPLIDRAALDAQHLILVENTLNTFTALPSFLFVYSMVSNTCPNFTPKYKKPVTRESITDKLFTDYENSNIDVEKSFNLIMHTLFEVHSHVFGNLPDGLKWKNVKLNTLEQFAIAASFVAYTWLGEIGIVDWKTQMSDYIEAVMRVSVEYPIDTDKSVRTVGLVKWRDYLDDCNYLAMKSKTKKDYRAHFAKHFSMPFNEDVWKEFINEMDIDVRVIKLMNRFLNYCIGVEDFHIQSPIEHAILSSTTKKADAIKPVRRKKKKSEHFELLGRTELNTFFNDSIVDILENKDVYAKFGIGFPEPFILEGPPGCGKTYAVKQLEEYLSIPTFHITSSSVGSQYVHATAKAIEETFAEAAKNDMSMVVVDEMESFMPCRDNVQHSDSHAIEEVNAFLKCIQTAQEKNILVVGMTNYLDRIDPAILRSGRMGTHIKVSWPSEEEIAQVFKYELDKRPYDKDIDPMDYASKFIERPLSDVCAVVRRAAMTAARKRADKVSVEDIEDAIVFVIGKTVKEEKRTIGFAV